MNLRLSLALVACGVVTASSGCTTPSAAFRGQSPDMLTATPTGWNPHHYGTPEQFYSGTESFSGSIGPWSPGVDGGMYYGDGAGPGQNRRQQRMMQRGILPPPGSPYANGYVPTPQIDPSAKPDHEINGVKVYDVGVHGWRPPVVAPGTPYADCRNQPYDLMPGGCPMSGAEYIRWMPTHYQTFQYNRPADLTYPSQNSVGGAVSYTYYTLKGPSDFFHDVDGVY